MEAVTGNDSDDYSLYNIEAYWRRGAKKRGGQLEFYGNHILLAAAPLNFFVLSFRLPTTSSYTVQLMCI